MLTLNGMSWAWATSLTHMTSGKSKVDESPPGRAVQAPVRWVCGALAQTELQQEALVKGRERKVKRLAKRES